MGTLRDNKGETLVEVLASILIAALSVALMFSCIMASTRMDQDAKTLDEKHYVDLSEADTQVTPTPGAVPDPVPTGSIVIENESLGESETLTIEIYGGDGMYSYKRKSP